MSDGMGRELAYLSSHATNRYFIPNWGKTIHTNRFNNDLVLEQNQVYELLTSSVDYLMLWGAE